MHAERLLGLLACPACRARLRAEPDRLACAGCAALYPVERGVPVVFEPGERDRLLTDAGHWGGEKVLTGANSARLGWLRRLMPPAAPFLNLASGRNLARLDRELAGRDQALLLDLGAGGGAGAGLGRLDRALRDQRTVRFDIAPFAGVNLVGSGERLPLRDAVFDAVLLKAVLEHVPDPAAVLAEARRVLRPGGWVYLEVPFLFEYHPNPGDYLRFTRQGIARLLGSFAGVEIGTLIGPWGAVASLLAQTGAITLSGGSRLVRKGLTPWLSWIFWPLSLPDLAVARWPTAEAAAHHLYAFARKPEGRQDEAQGSS